MSKLLMGNRQIRWPIVIEKEITDKKKYLITLKSFAKPSSNWSCQKVMLKKQISQFHKY